MEVGAVKQAFNNEVIHLKKSLNQARIQTIHKLTRKAKTLVDKKAPEHIKDKLKRKAESAVKEVLVLKKIKPKDIAKFIVTHKNDLQSYLNKPDVDEEKACARLLLHKALQGKYNLIRNSYCNVPIEDLFMSRLERRKLKKEQKEMQKNKKKEKEARKRNNSAGDWKIEEVDNVKNLSVQKLDVVVDKSSSLVKGNIENNFSKKDEFESQSEENEDISNDGDNSEKEDISENEDKFKTLDSKVNDMETDEESNVIDSDSKAMSDDHASSQESENDDDDNEVTGSFVKTPIKEKVINKKITPLKPMKEDKRKKLPKQNKDPNKNKKLPDKKHLKKNKEIKPPVAIKVADPFFVTATGENYMSLAEPRAPDEVKEIHKQGNRKIRRAAMFGHEPKLNHRNSFRKNDNKFNKQNNFNKSNDFSSNFDNNAKKSPEQFSKHNRFTNDTNDRFGKDSIKGVDKFDAKPEKLHPSWEAKKKLSSVLPFQGKKIVFNDG